MLNHTCEIHQELGMYNIQIALRGNLWLKAMETEQRDNDQYYSITHYNTF